MIKCYYSYQPVSDLYPASCIRRIVISLMKLYVSGPAPLATLSEHSQISGDKQEATEEYKSHINVLLGNKAVLQSSLMSNRAM